MWFVHKYRVAMRYGGPEEGGWWYDTGTPDEDWTPIELPTEALAYEQCRLLNMTEKERRDVEEDYNYTSVLAYRSRHYQYDVSQDPEPHDYPETRPHYE